MTTAYILVITFFTAYSGYGVSIAPVAMPGTYTLEQCNTAGREAEQRFNGGAEVEWTCVPAAEATP